MYYAHDLPLWLVSRSNRKNILILAKSIGANEKQISTEWSTKIWRYRHTRISGRFKKNQLMMNSSYLAVNVVSLKMNDWKENWKKLTNGSTTQRTLTSLKPKVSTFPFNDDHSVAVYYSNHDDKAPLTSQALILFQNITFPPAPTKQVSWPNFTKPWLSHNFNLTFIVVTMTTPVLHTTAAGFSIVSY